MLIAELRDLLKKYGEEDLRFLISEMYKSVPKKLREEKAIDSLLQDVSAYRSMGKAEKAKNKQIDIEALKSEIGLFLEDAYKQYYFAPNSVIHKKERPKWRFKVKAYIQELQRAPVEGAEGKMATELLMKLYEMLCYGCCYYIFNTDNPFRSVGIVQTSLLGTIIGRCLCNGIDQESAKNVVNLVIDHSPDRDTLHSSLICELMAKLKTPDAKEMVVNQAQRRLKELQEHRTAVSKKSNSYADYERKEKMSHLVEIVFRVNVDLCEFDEAIQYFKKNCVESSRKEMLDVLLGLLREYRLKELWVREYEEARKKGVKIRETLDNTYKHILANDSFPENFIYRDLLD